MMTNKSTVFSEILSANDFSENRVRDAFTVDDEISVVQRLLFVHYIFDDEIVIEAESVKTQSIIM